MGAYLESVICPVCKKEFIPAPEHIYKIGRTELVCSWSCVMKWEKERERKKGARRK